VVVIDDFEVPGWTLLFPSVRSGEETGARRGCIVLASPSMALETATVPTFAWTDPGLVHAVKLGPAGTEPPAAVGDLRRSDQLECPPGLISGLSAANKGEALPRFQQMADPDH
jgi:hypothetical protein